MKMNKRVKRFAILGKFSGMARFEFLSLFGLELGSVEQCEKAIYHLVRNDFVSTSGWLAIESPDRKILKTYYFNEGKLAE